MACQSALHLRLFIPDSILSQISMCFYVGKYRIVPPNLFACCAAAFRCDNDYESIGKKLSECIDTSQEDIFIGLIYDVEGTCNINKNFIEGLKFILRVDNSSKSFYFENIFFQNVVSETVIIYDNYDLYSSKLLPLLKTNCNEFDGINCSFVDFLIHTVNNFRLERLEDQEIDARKQLAFEDNVQGIHLHLMYSTFMKFFIVIFSIFLFFSESMKKWWPHFLSKIVLFSSVGCILHQRIVHLTEIAKSLKSKRELSLSCRNLILAILFDLTCGWIITYILQYSYPPLSLLDPAMDQINALVNELQKIIHWLMGVPAGLKLNIPLNNALGKFFLYHIYLWKTYITVIKPVFGFILEISSIIGVFGVTFFFSLINDLISVSSVHIYCFYGYAARLYGYQMTSLVALWRLFRGKKWNPLRQRVDSYTYDVYQLYLGTLLFTILLFLLPTVMVYYFVFTVLRIAVLIFQGIISRIVNVLNIFPVYTIMLRTFNSSQTTGDVYFNVINTEGALVLTMQIVQVPLMTVIKATTPKLQNYEEIISWKNFSSSIVWGKIIYPL